MTDKQSFLQLAVTLSIMVKSVDLCIITCLHDIALVMNCMLVTCRIFRFNNCWTKFQDDIWVLHFVSSSAACCKSPQYKSMRVAIRPPASALPYTLFVYPVPCLYALPVRIRARAIISRTELRGLTSCVLVDSSLGKHGIVLNLRLPDWWAVVADDHQLCCTINVTVQYFEVAQRL